MGLRLVLVVALLASAASLVAGSSARPHSPEVFTTTGPLTPGPSGDFRFGWSVALASTSLTAIVGEPSRGHGTAWVFERSGYTWRHGARLTAGGTGARFGYSVAISDNGRIALIGAPWDNAKKGTAWIYRKTTPGTWVGQQLKPSGARGSQPQFGSSVALSSDGAIAFIGGAGDDYGKGALWIFTRSGSTWKQSGGKHTPNGGKGQSEYGTSLEVSGDGRIVAIGGPGDLDQQGAFWTLTRSGSAWKPGAKFTYKTPLTQKSARGKLGADLALSTDGHHLLVTAPGRTAKPTTQTFRLVRSGSAWTTKDEDYNRARGVAISGTGARWIVGGFLYPPASPGAAPLAVAGGKSIDFSDDGRAVIHGDPDYCRRPGNGSICDEGGFANIRVDAPSVSEVTPGAGPASGGTPVTITGRDFVGVTGVFFGTTAATSFAVDGPTQIRAVSPPSQTGLVHVRVATRLALSPATPTGSFGGTADGFVYVERPVVTAISPATGPTAGGTTVTITGTGFTGATLVLFGGTPATSFHVDSATKITAVSPESTAGIVDVTVTTPGGRSATTTGDRFTYVAPTVSEKVITFDNLTTAGPGSATGAYTRVTSQYAPDATFNSPYAIDYSRPPNPIASFAHSGSVGIEQCIGAEFCTTPILLTFAKTQSYVRLYVGVSFPLSAPLTVELRAFDTLENVIKTTSVTLPGRSSPTPISNALEVQTSARAIKQVQVLVPGGYMNGVAVDHIVFRPG